MYSAVPVDRWMANALFREVPDDEEDEDEKKDHEEEEKDEEEEKGIRNEEHPSPTRHLSRSAQADFVVGRRNSMTLPRSCGGSHFSRFENLIGM